MDRVIYQSHTVTHTHIDHVPDADTLMKTTILSDTSIVTQRIVVVVVVVKLKRTSFKNSYRNSHRKYGMLGITHL